MTCRIEESDTQQAMLELISKSEAMLTDNDFPALVLASSRKLLHAACNAFEERGKRCEVLEHGILQEKRDEHESRVPAGTDVLILAVKELGMDPDDPDFDEDCKYAWAPPLLLPLSSVKQLVVVGAQSFRPNYLEELAEVAFDQNNTIDLLLLAHGSGDSYEARMEEIYSRLVADSPASSDDDSTTATPSELPAAPTASPNPDVMQP